MQDDLRQYVTELDYTFGYYHELNPNRHRLPFILKSMAPTEIKVACELGFGQGLSLAVHAAGSMVSWYGTDLNASQARFASELAALSHSDCHIVDQPFSEFCARQDLPQFDFIGLHGIWSWISDENRKVIVDFIAKKLKVGGIVYVSYNTLPGWSSAAPIRHALTSFTKHMTAAGLGLKKRIEQSLSFVDRLFSVDPIYGRANPNAKPRFDKLKEQNLHYLAHEYFNQNWKPMYFSEMANLLEDAKLTFAGSAHYLDNVDIINLKSDQKALLDEVSDPIFRETIRDYIVNQQFRRDYWVKGLRLLTPLEQVEALHEIGFILTTYPKDIEYKFTGILGELSMDEDVYRPIIDILEDGNIHSFGKILERLKTKNINQAQLAQAIEILCGHGHISITHQEEEIEKNSSKTNALNIALLRKARSSTDIQYLASPVTGGGFAVGRIPQLFTLALVEGHKDVEACVQYAWRILSVQKQALIKDGEVLKSAEANIAELKLQAEAYHLKILPLLKALKIITV